MRLGGKKVYGGGKEGKKCPKRNTVRDLSSFFSMGTNN
jgi:hypothetical protein